MSLSVQNETSVVIFSKRQGRFFAIRDWYKTAGRGLFHHQSERIVVVNSRLLKIVLICSE
ncbi:hypothetical protein X975_09554, partial [Stegodyphus mimosarum]